MRRCGRWLALAGVLLLVLAALGCRGEPSGEPGVAATVNGEPIRVAALEARHDLSRLGLPVADNPTVERLRQEYGAVLAGMIVARLAGQELARQHLSVTEAELAAAEAAVRADYPDEAFEAMLVEERIDPQRWREALRDRLILDKFTRDVLRPNVRIGVTEAAAYYKEHIGAFTTPARTRLLLVLVREAETAKALLAAYRKTPTRDTLAGQAGVTLQELTITDRNLAKSWREALRGLKSGEAGPVMAEAEGSAFLVLLERQPETVLEPAKAYAQVETILTARKLEDAMAAWLTEAAAQARIEINPLLAASGQVAAPDRTSETDPGTGGSAANETRTDQAAAPSGNLAAAPFEKASSPAMLPAEPAPPAPEAAVSAAEIPAQAQVQIAEASSGAVAAKPSAEEAAAASPAVAIAAGVAPSEPPVPAETAPAVSSSPDAEKQAAQATGEVEFIAIKASWILYTTDDAPEERTYLKPGTPLRLAFTRRLAVRLGSPSEVSYRFGARKETVVVGKKESRLLEFP